MSDEEYTFEIWRGGMMVVQISASNLNDARREAMHYAITYAQDGPVEIRGAAVASLMPETPDDPAPGTAGAV